MPNVFLEYYNKEALTWIGDTIKIDINTSCQLRGHYARICVLVDLSKQLMSGFSLDGQDYYMEYEGLHSLCTSCGIYGHTSEECKAGDGKKRAGEEVYWKSEGDTTAGMDIEDSKRSDQDVWRVVRKSNWLKCGGKDKQSDSLRHQNKGSQFGVLAGEVEGDSGICREDITSAVAVQDNGLVIEESRINSSVQISREKKGGEHKRQSKSINPYKEVNVEMTGHQDQRKEKRTRDKTQKMEKTFEKAKLSYENSNYTEAESDICKMQEIKSVGPTEKELSIVESFSTLPSDPGESGRFGGPVGRFWVGPSEEGMECEIVEESQLENIGPKTQI